MKLNVTVVSNHLSDWRACPKP